MIRRAAIARRLARATCLLLACVAGGIPAAVTSAATEDREFVPGTSSGTLVTSPARQLASVAPGGRTTFPMIVQNRLGRTATVEVDTFDLAPGTDSYSELVEAGSQGRGAGTWLAPEAGTFVLRDGERRTFQVAVAVPTTAGPGGHFGAVTVEVKPEQDDDDRIGVGVRIATNVTVLVPGDVRYDGRVRDVRLAASGRDRMRVTFDAEVTGNIQSIPVATIEVTGDPFRKTSRRRLELPEILPGGERTVTTTLPRRALVGRARASVRLQFEDRSRSGTARSDTTWLVPPWTYLAGAAAVIALLVIGIVLFRRRQLRLLLERYGDDWEDDDLDDDSDGRSDEELTVDPRMDDEPS